MDPAEYTAPGEGLCTAAVFQGETMATSGHAILILPSLSLQPPLHFGLHLGLLASSLPLPLSRLASCLIIPLQIQPQSPQTPLTGRSNQSAFITDLLLPDLQQLAISTDFLPQLQQSTVPADPQPDLPDHHSAISANTKLDLQLPASYYAPQRSAQFVADLQISPAFVADLQISPVFTTDLQSGPACLVIHLVTLWSDTGYLYCLLVTLPRDFVCLSCPRSPSGVIQAFSPASWSPSRSVMSFSPAPRPPT
eukprot:superscaffoldBa00002542_g14590